jgi:hypothetical protein
MSLPSNSGTGKIVPVHDVVPIERMSGEDDEDTVFLRAMFEEATNYIRSFSWCDSITGSYFAGGVGKIFAIFLFQITSPNPHVDSWEWIFVEMSHQPIYRSRTLRLNCEHSRRTLSA